MDKLEPEPSGEAKLLEPEREKTLTATAPPTGRNINVRIEADTTNIEKAVERLRRELGRLDPPIITGRLSSSLKKGK